MAYGQTGTGKTFTIGQLGEEDASDPGIMVRSGNFCQASAVMWYSDSEESM